MVSCISLFMSLIQSSWKIWTKDSLLPSIQEHIKHIHTQNHMAVLSQGAHQSIIVIASSCGGPIAFRQLISSLPHSLHTPILIAQHVLKMFDTSLCASLNDYTQRTVLLGRHGMKEQENHIYLAPFDFHMEVRQQKDKTFIILQQNPKKHFLRPAADHLFRSAARIFKEKTIGVILTGMGEDGTDGGAAIKRQGGTIICQDEESSIMWGMPSAAIQANIHTSILPIQEIGTALLRQVMTQEG